MGHHFFGVVVLAGGDYLGLACQSHKARNSYYLLEWHINTSEEYIIEESVCFCFAYSSYPVYIHISVP